MEEGGRGEDTSVPSTKPRPGGAGGLTRRGVGCMLYTTPKRNKTTRGNGTAMSQHNSTSLHTTTQQNAPGAQHIANARTQPDKTTATQHNTQHGTGTSSTSQHITTQHISPLNKTTQQRKRKIPQPNAIHSKARRNSIFFLQPSQIDALSLLSFCSDVFGKFVLLLVGQRGAQWDRRTLRRIPLLWLIGDQQHTVAHV